MSLGFTARELPHIPTARAIAAALRVVYYGVTRHHLESHLHLIRTSAPSYFSCRGKTQQQAPRPLPSSLSTSETHARLTTRRRSFYSGDLGQLLKSCVVTSKRCPCTTPLGSLNTTDLDTAICKSTMATQHPSALPRFCCQKYDVDVQDSWKLCS
jgi:hypothetical protein